MKMEKILKWAFDCGIEIKIQSQFIQSVNPFTTHPVITFSRENRQHSIAALDWSDLTQQVLHIHQRIFVDLCCPPLEESEND